MAEALYFSLIVCAFYAEISTKINTKTILQKTALALIILGSLIALAGHSNNLMLVGMLCYLIDKIIGSIAYRLRNS